LLKTHAGKYVAIHEERIVASGNDPIALIKQVHERYGYVPIHVDLVTEQPPPLVRLPHYRAIGSQEPARFVTVTRTSFNLPPLSST
jgi:hypothetical protein